MALFDSLGYARYPRDGGVPQEQAETHAEAARRFIVADLVTKDDLEVQTLRITVRLGAMLVVGFGIMTAVIGLLLKFH
jgi:hypothetical protein